jgi:hypothetical protein
MSSAPKGRKRVTKTAAANNTELTAFVESPAPTLAVTEVAAEPAQQSHKRQCLLRPAKSPAPPKRRRRL